MTSEPASAERDASRCPLCGAPNLCAMAAGLVDEPCWCSQIDIAPGVISSVPAHERGKRCVCPCCAAGPS